MENPDLMDPAMMVVLPLATDSGDGLVCRPLLHRRQHAKGLGEIEMGGGCGRLQPV